MSKSKRDQPTQDDVNRLSTMLGQVEDDSQRALHEGIEFKPGELTPKEEELVRRMGLNALNYIPQKTLDKQSEAFHEYEEKMRKRAEIMSRPKTDPERMRLEREERAQKFRQALEERFNGFGYGMFLFLIVGFTVLIIDSHGWSMGIFSCLLMLAVLELSYRLYAHH